MQKVVGSNPIIRSSKAPETGLFVDETGDGRAVLQAVLQALRARVVGVHWRATGTQAGQLVLDVAGLGSEP